MPKGREAQIPVILNPIHITVYPEEYMTKIEGEGKNEKRVQLKESELPDAAKKAYYDYTLQMSEFWYMIRTVHVEVIISPQPFIEFAIAGMAQALKHARLKHHYDYRFWVMVENADEADEISKKISNTEIDTPWQEYFLGFTTNKPEMFRYLAEQYPDSHLLVLDNDVTQEEAKQYSEFNTLSLGSGIEPNDYQTMSNKAKMLAFKKQIQTINAPARLTDSYKRIFADMVHFHPDIDPKDFIMGTDKEWVRAEKQDT